MCNYSDGILYEGVEIGVKNTKRKNALEMLKDNLPVDLIVRYSGLSYEEVVALKNAA